MNKLYRVGDYLALLGVSNILLVRYHYSLFRRCYTPVSVTPNGICAFFKFYFLNRRWLTGSTRGRLQRGSSRVGFLPSEVTPPTDVPLDLTDELFEAVEDVQTFTLQASQLAVVISSYDKTIGKIQKKGV